MRRREAVAQELTWIPIAGVAAFLLQGGPAIFGDSALTWSVALLAPLPVALAARATIRASFLAMLLAAVLLGAVRAPDALLFLLTTGPLGVLLGWGNAVRMRTLPHWALCAATLAIGVVTAGYGLQLPATWMDWMGGGIATTVGWIVLLPSIYSALWLMLLRQAAERVSISMPGSSTTDRHRDAPRATMHRRQSLRGGRR